MVIVANVAMRNRTISDLRETDSRRRDRLFGCHWVKKLLRLDKVSYSGDRIYWTLVQ